MINIAFYIDNSKISNIDCSQLLEGNPGIGGTEYLFYYTAYKLQSYSGFHIQLLTSSYCKLPSDCNHNIVKNKEDAISFCKKSKIDILIVKYEEKDYYPNIFTNINFKIKIVIWAHNIIPDHILTIIAKTKIIKKIINVSSEQLDLYRDHLAFKKSTFIYNSINIKPQDFYTKKSTPYFLRRNEVTYLGSLVPIKGFHVLAKAWPEILKKIPDAHLNVIGSGNVYGNSKLGKYGIAEEEYEKMFMPYLTNGNGEILPSVTFWGKLGQEKNNILAKTKVGVPNPLGYSETFCLSAVEMELYGCKIVTKKYVGFLNTVHKHTGILYSNEQDITSCIIQALNCTENNSNYNFLKKNFGEENVINNWINILDCIYYNKKTYTPNCKNLFYNYKFLRETNRRIKNFIPFGHLLPTINFYFKIWNKIFPSHRIEILY